LQFLEYLVLFENKIRYTLGILKAYKALNIPQIDTEVNPAETCPSPSCRRSSSDKIQPCPKPFTVFSHIKTNLLVHGLIAPDQPRANPVPEPAEV